jgi:hypothetical protein
LFAWMSGKRRARRRMACRGFSAWPRPGYSRVRARARFGGDDRIQTSEELLLCFPLL